MNLSRRDFLLGSIGIVSALGLTACSNSSTTDSNTEPESREPSQKEMLNQAEELDLEAFHEMDSENEAKAKKGVRR